MVRMSLRIRTASVLARRSSGAEYSHESEITLRNIQSVDKRRHQVFAARVRVNDPRGCSTRAYCRSARCCFGSESRDEWRTPTHTKASFKVAAKSRTDIRRNVTMGQRVESGRTTAPGVDRNVTLEANVATDGDRFEL